MEGSPEKNYTEGGWALGESETEGKTFPPTLLGRKGKAFFTFTFVREKEGVGGEFMRGQ